MLKLIRAITAASLVMFLGNGPANAGLAEDLQNICTIVKTNDKSQLRKKIKKVQSDYSLKLRDYYSGITCGGNSLIRTAMLNEALDAGKLLIKKMPKKYLVAPEKDGKTLLAWASEKGLQDSPVATTLSERI